MKRVLVTGGAGFIGSRLVERLVERKNEVYVLDNLSSGFESNIMKNEFVKFYNGDVRHNKIVDSLVKDCDVVFHLAEYIPNTANFGCGHVVKFSIDNPLLEFDVSCKGTLTVLESARQYLKKFIFISTAAVYGETQKPFITEDQPTLPVSPYGTSKLCAETYVQLYQRIYDCPTLILRLFNVYGPKQRKYVMYDILRKLAINSNELQVLGNGNEERDFIFVDDVINALLLVAEKESAVGQIFNVGTGKPTSLHVLVKLILDALCIEPDLVFTKSSWKGNVTRLCADVTKLKKLGFSPQYELNFGIQYMVKWFNSTEKNSVLEALTQKQICS